MAESKIYWTEDLLDSQYRNCEEHARFLESQAAEARLKSDHFLMLLHAKKDGCTIVSVIPDRPTGMVCPTISEDS